MNGEKTRDGTAKGASVSRGEVIAEARDSGGSGSSSSSSTRTRSIQPTPAVDFTAGVIAGAAGLVVGQPFDVVKVRFQTPEYHGRYKGTFSAFGAILKEEKVHGLFKGVLSPMAGIAFINGIVFSSYSFFMRMQVPRTGTGERSMGSMSSEPSLTQIFLAGAGSGMVGALLTCPTELIKIRQQAAPPHLDPSILDVCRGILRTDGVRGLYRGFSATVLRDLAYGPYFCTYEAVCRYFKSMKPPPPPRSSTARHHHDNLIDEAEAELASGLTWGELMIAGGVAGVIAWIATFPLDVFKTRMQASRWVEGSDSDNRHGSESRKSTITKTTTATARLAPRRQYKQTLRQVVRTAIREDGWRVCFAGLGPCLIRAIPVNMIVFVTFEACVAALSR